MTTSSGQAASEVKDFTLVSRTIIDLPVEVDGGGGDKFTLVAMVIVTRESGVTYVRHELRMRCNDCDWGYNSYPYIRLGDVTNIGHRAKHHVGECKNTGRTFDVHSLEVARP